METNDRKNNEMNLGMDEVEMQKSTQVIKLLYWLTIILQKILALAICL